MDNRADDKRYLKIPIPQASGRRATSTDEAASCVCFHWVRIFSIDGLNSLEILERSLLRVVRGDWVVAMAIKVSMMLVLLRRAVCMTWWFVCRLPVSYLVDLRASDKSFGISN